MITTNIDAETTNEKIQALLDYLNEENGIKLKKRDIKIEEQPYSKSGALYHTPFGTYNVLKAMMQLIRELKIYGMI